MKELTAKTIMCQMKKIDGRCLLDFSPSNQKTSVKTSENTGNLVSSTKATHLNRKLSYTRDAQS